MSQQLKCDTQTLKSKYMSSRIFHWTTAEHIDRDHYFNYFFLTNLVFLSVFESPFATL